MMHHKPEIHVEELKKDKEFLANIKRLEAECKEQESVAKGYQLLDAQLIIEAAEDEINEIFTFIVNTAFDKLAQKLSTDTALFMDDDEDRAVARAIYEHGMQLYSENNQKGAKEIFLILSYVIDKLSLKDAMLLHAAVVISGKSFDDFIAQYVDVEQVDIDDPLAFFVQTFTFSISEMFDLFVEEVALGRKEIEVFATSQKGYKE